MDPVFRNSKLEAVKLKGKSVTGQAEFTAFIWVERS